MNINNINVNKYPVSQVLSPSGKDIYEIPKYQREYTWGIREWEALFDDLIENEQGYFLGSVICIRTTTNTLNEPKYEVVDGQQRLTTLSLFLAALYERLNSHKNLLNEEEDQQSNLQLLKRQIVIKRAQTYTRVVPQIQSNNLEDYLDLLSDIGIIPKRPSVKFAKLRRIRKAYSYFIQRIDAALEETDDKVAGLFNILEKVNDAILVMIEVSNHADAYTLFESLNNRGIPLTAVDLIKNLLLAKLDANGPESLDYYFTQWTEIISNLGEDYAVQERFFRQNYNAFRKKLNAPFKKDERQYPLGIIATRSTMLDIYEKLITKNPIGSLDELSENAAIYATIVLNKTDELTPALRDCYQDLQRVQGAPSYLLLLYLIKNRELLNIGDDIVKICRLLVNFFVRRNLTDTPATHYLTRMFMSYIEEIEQNEYRGATIYDKLRGTLVECSASREIFEEKLHGPVYDDNRDATRFILCSMAKRGMTIETERDLWRQNGSNQYVWSIEHIFPQGSNIPNEWVEMIADGDREKAKEYQSFYVHTLGNLTITGYNSTLGNKSFVEKKERKDANGNFIGYRNGFKLNEDVCDKEKWTVEIIKARTDRMVKEILSMFALE